MHTVDEQTEVLVPDAARHQEHARVILAKVYSNHNDRHEIPNVAGDQHAIVVRSEIQQIGIAESFERPLLINGTDVMTTPAQSHPDSFARDMRIQEQPHRPGVTIAGYRICHSPSGRRFSAIASSISAGYA